MQFCSRWLKSPRQILNGRKVHFSSPSFLSLWKPDYVTRSKSDGPHKKRVAIISAGPCGLVAFILLNKFGVSTLPVEIWWWKFCALNYFKKVNPVDTPSTQPLIKRTHAHSVVQLRPTLFECLSEQNARTMPPRAHFINNRTMEVSNRYNSSTSFV